MAPGLHLVEQTRVHQVARAEEGQRQRDDHGQQGADQRDGEGLPCTGDRIGHHLAGEIRGEQAFDVLDDGAAAFGAEQHAEVDLRPLIAPDEERPQQRQQQIRRQPRAAACAIPQRNQVNGSRGRVIHSSDRTLALM